MITMEIVSEKKISPTEVLSLLEELEDRNEAQSRTLEHLKRNLAVQDPDTFEELFKEIAEEDVFRDEHILKILETLPMSEREVNALFSKERIKLDDSDIERVIEFSQSIGAD